MRIAPPTSGLPEPRVILGLIILALPVLAGPVCTGPGLPTGDVCAENGWYGDGECDEFCPQPDPDCDTVCPSGFTWNASTADCRNADGCPEALPYLWTDGMCYGTPEEGEEEDPLAGIDPSTPYYEDVRDLVDAAEAATGAKDQFEALVASGDADPVQSLIDALEDDPDITNVELSIDGATVEATLSNGIVVGIATDERDRDDWIITEQEGASAKVAADNKSVIPSIEGPVPVRGSGWASTHADDSDGSIICDETTYPQSKTACMIMGFQEQFDPFNEQPPKLTEPLQRAGYEIKNLTLKTPQDLVTLQQELPNCGVIYIQSHGKVRKNLDGTFGNNITTEIELDLKNPTSIFDMMEVFGDNWQRFLSADSIGKADQAIVAWSLTPEFFAQFDYKNSFVYADVCNSDYPTMGNQLADVFLAKGAGAFVGWQGPIANGIAKLTAELVFDALAPTEAVTGVDSVTISTDPADPGAGQSYVPSAQVSPIVAGMQIKLSISGTDGFSFTETVTTDVGGQAVFTTIPGGAGGVVDTLTVVAGGADNSAALAEIIRNNPELENKVWSQPWSEKGYTVANLSVIASELYNLICNNQTLTETTTVVKF